MINGIDVSHHNDIKWNNIQKLSLTQNVYFAFLKASEGLSNPDAKFAANRTGSAGAGLLSGGYHFFIPTADAAQQADILSSRIGSLLPGELPPVVDIEWTLIKGKRPELWENLTAAKRIEVIKTFLDEVEKRLGVKPIIYTAVSFWNDFIITKPNTPASYAFFIDYPLWIVNLKGAMTAPKPFSVATFVQNSFGELAPKNATAFEKLDHDFFNGGLSGLLSLMTKGKVFAKGSPVSAVVRDFQQLLKNRGLYSDLLDGDFGGNTETAVKAFQKSVGLKVTGQIDENTWKLLF
jgi:GH25 family lysozyme M1 (1,4-beta-N-acetylmuramidase)